VAPVPRLEPARAHLQFEALAAATELSCAFVLPDDEPGPELPPGREDVPVSTVPLRRRSGRAALGRWATPRRGRGPWPAVKLAFDEAASGLRPLVADSGADVIWAVDSHLWPALAPLDLGGRPLVVDLDDLQDEKIAHRQRNRRPLRQLSRREAFFRATDVVDRRRWRRAQLDIASRADAVLLCSELDRARFGHPAVRLLPNAYALERAVAPRPQRPASHRLVFAGNLGYLPNGEALGFFVEEILPLVRAEVPDVELRVVGRGADAVAHLAGRANVTFLGELATMDDELAASAACVVPLLSGGGTRIKILEALAHRVPVVTTTIGVEGLDLVDGQHLLVRDDAAAFAAAAVQLLRDPVLAEQLTTRGAERYDRDHTPATVRRAVGAILAELPGVSAGSGPPAPGAPAEPR